ncbi:MAG: 50S ribosomal protein L6 [Candidatus Yanofskybacteria bacterium RIFCSPHIGHO2_01_FULL_44_17]|uniref:Large ribosomal subunit protein uL6 n=1 Tax=Candidatus Yanofskybacteria bacterium RIFCSPHIGHO2_01_FULL_44_17 TaxID=1802668 RepID=A0A1F8ETN2_9BACT|nr:MAG: 50S ribosomal protein L6 [Candidatus Yanofskybacteria bacterium RIFCSPHIGHO2_01_FULL_44_17]
MSRIGKKTIKIPDGVEVKVDGQTVKVKGPKGELERTLPGILDIKVESGFARVSLKSEAVGNREGSKFWGLGRALLATMIEGVSSGFEKVLEFSGVGFKAQVKGDSIELSLGYSNPVIIQAPAGVNYQVEKNVIKVFGIDKEKVGQVAALIRDARPPEPYKGTGIKYKDEIIIRKAGKKAVATAG